MRFSGERHVPAPVAQVWTALHDSDVLRAIIPGCEELVLLDAGTYAATLAARVGPVADTYRGTFSIADPRQGSEILVEVGAAGRCGRLGVTLRVVLGTGRLPGTTILRYAAEATVGGFVSRLGRTTLTLAGHHFTGCFFRDLDRSVRGAPVAEPVPALV